MNNSWIFRGKGGKMKVQGADIMNIASIVRKYHNLDKKVVINNQSATFQSKIDSRLQFFHLSIKDFKVMNEYYFNEEAVNLLIEIHDFDLKHYAKHFSNDDLSKIEESYFNELCKLVEDLLKAHFKDEKQLRDKLLKVYAAETEIGMFDNNVLESLNLLQSVNPMVKKRAMNDIRLLFLEPFSEIRYPNLNTEDRHDLFIEFIGQFESEIYDFLDRIKERDSARIQNKEMPMQELKNLIMGDY